MSQNNSNEKTSSSLDVIGTINQVPDFDPRMLAVNYTDLKTGETRARLPVVAQIAWFRLKYPEGKISVRVEHGTNCFVATARVYPSYKDGAENYISEATASRGKCEEKPSVSAREWAQTAAIGVALRNAGFGLQFQLAGEDFSENAPDEFAFDVTGETGTSQNGSGTPVEEEKPKRELTAEEKYKAALDTKCTVSKYSGKTMSEILMLDANFINWLVKKYQYQDTNKEAAQIICEYAARQQAAV